MKQESISYNIKLADIVVSNKQILVLSPDDINCSVEFLIYDPPGLYVKVSISLL